MNTLRPAGYILILFTHIFISNVVLASDNHARLAEMLKHAHNSNKRLYAAETDEQRKDIAADELQQYLTLIAEAPSIDEPGGSIVRYWAARLHLYTGNHDEFHKIADDLALQRTVATEVWMGLLEVSIGNNKINFHRRAEIGRILPLSMFSE